MVPARVMIKDLGPALVLKILGADTFICAYVLNGRREFTVASTSAIISTMDWPYLLEVLECLKEPAQEERQPEEGNPIIPG
jgi:hypothetical protein